MIDSLVNLDNQLFFFINLRGHNALTDFLASFLVDWPFFLIVLLFVFSERHRKTAWILVLTMVLSVVINSILLKNIFKRPRPYWIFTEAVHIEGNSFLWSEEWRPPLTSYAFPSGHTALAGAVALVAFLRHKKLRLAVVILTLSTSIARVFVGVHRPLDVVAGILTGGLTGLMALFLMRFLPKQMK